MLPTCIHLTFISTETLLKSVLKPTVAYTACLELAVTFSKTTNPVLTSFGVAEALVGDLHKTPHNSHRGVIDLQRGLIKATGLCVMHL